jgi:hypothetical protein
MHLRVMSIPVRRRRTVFVAAAACVMVSGCRDTRSGLAVEAAYRLSLGGSGGRVSAVAGAVAPVVLPVRVDGPDGSGVGGVRVRFRIVRGQGGGTTLEDEAGVTEPAGTAAARVVVGPDADTVIVAATLAVDNGIEVRATIVTEPGPRIAAVTPATAGPGDTLTVAGTGFGDGPHAIRFNHGVAIPALPGGTPSRIRVVVPSCQPDGAGAVQVEARGAVSPDAAVSLRAVRSVVTLAPYEATTIEASALANCVALGGPAGSRYLVAAGFASSQANPVAIDWRLDAAGSALPAAGALMAQAPPTVRPRADIGFEMHRRALEREVAGIASASAAAAAPEPAIGSLRRFQVVASIAGDRFTTVVARLRFAGRNVYVYTDTADMAFPDARLAALGAHMDGDLYTTTVNAFGAPSDLDGDGHVTILLTPVANRMSRASECVQRGYVTGFFYGVDLVERDPHSNRAEVFYGFVPDSTGQYSCPHTASDVEWTLRATFPHELQHLISFNQHVLVRGGVPEAPWLNEGLSHAAEELVARVYDARYPAPLGRSTGQQLYPDSAGPYIAPQLLNAYIYLRTAVDHSVTSYTGAGGIEERGATWMFLRWLADQKGDDVLGRLVRSNLTGVANVERAAGESFGALFGDFSASLVTDSIPGVPRPTAQRRRFRGRSLRQLMAREATIAGFVDPFPLAAYRLDAGGTLRSAMLPGTMIHALVTIGPSGAPVRLAFTTPQFAAFPPAARAQVTVVRLP